MNIRNCLYIYGSWQMAMAGAITNCYILHRVAIYSWQIQLAGRYPRRPSQPSPEPTWGVPARDQPQIAARGDRLLFAGASIATPYFNIGHKKRCASNTPQTSIFNLLRS